MCCQELNEQASYEGSDDVVEKPPRHWMINDLVLFVDSEDTPRIPVQLFHDVIQIRVAGVPGPIYRGHIEAFRQLSKIVLFVLFVFLVVLSFGSVYKISATNQTLATMVGGFLPRMLRMFLAPPRPEVELGTVSFKSKMDEVIKNFCQYWPIYDLPFELVTDKDEKEVEKKNDNRGENTTPTTRTCLEESKYCDEQTNHLNNGQHHGYDDLDGGGTDQQLLSLQHQTSEERAECPAEKLEKVTVIDDALVDLAICLPSWKKTPVVGDRTSSL